MSSSLATRLFWFGLAAVPTGFLLVFFCYPVVSIVALGFFPHGQFDVSEMAATLQANRTWLAAGRTIAQAGLATLLCVVLGIPGAYVCYRLEWPGRTILRAIISLPFVLPSVVVAVAFRALLAEGGPLAFLGWDGSLFAVIAAMVFFDYSVVVRIVGGVWAKLDPRTEQAAQSLGAGPFRTLVTVTLPQLVPAILSAASLVFLFCATAYAVVLMLGGPALATLEVEIWLQTTQFLNLPAASVLSVLQLLVVLAALTLANRAKERTETKLRLEETPNQTRYSPGRLLGVGWTWFAAAVTAVMLVLIVTPLATMVVRSLRDNTGWTTRFYFALADRGPVSVPVPIREAATNSLRIAFDATMISLLVGVALAVVLARRPATAWARRWLEVWTRS